MERLTKMVGPDRLMHPVTIRTDDKYHYLTTPMSLKDEAKSMKGSHWCGFDPIPEKVWRVDNCRRNNFNIAYLEGKNPFAKYRKPLVDATGQGFQLRKTRVNYKGETCLIYEHQQEMTLHMLIRRQCIISGEMGVGKTLSAIEASELSLVPEAWYVAPKSALASVKLECMKWKCRTNFRFMTYDELKKTLKEWVPGTPPPRMVIFDESSRVKTPTSQRSQAAYYLAESMRDAYGDDAYIILMSGSPAPKSPLDWYWQCEIACPGYIREGDIHKFQYRLAVMSRQEDITGTKFSKLMAWRDGNPKVCNTCGLPDTHETHVDPVYKGYHTHIPLTNEVEKLYKRMSGLTLVKFKKDCLSLPDKIYRVIKIKPTLDLLRAARMISAQSRSAIQQMTLMRELSDGFQYRDSVSASAVCEFCNGNKVTYKPDGTVDPCAMCGATGSKNRVEREVIEVQSPKLDVVNDLLEECEDQGRIVFYAGFTASIDRLCKHVDKQGWKFIRVDGRGWFNNMNHTWDNLKMLQEFQDGKEDKIAFIGHPGSAGMGITLTASSMICYVSNDFNAESRIQSEDRIHRAGMDVNRGATIVDLILLPTDEKVLENLKRKRELQSISLGELQAAINDYQYTTS